jgi:hypothetical protein
MEKELIVLNVFWAAFIVLGLTGYSVYSNWDSTPKSPEITDVYSPSLTGMAITGRAILTPTAITNCSNESITAVWDSIFKETSDKINITAGVISGRCAITAYKIKNKELYYLILGSSETISQNDLVITAYHVNATPTYQYSEPVLISSLFSINMTARAITTSEAATSEFSNSFKATPSAWQTSVQEGSIVYSYNETSDSRTNTGMINANSSINTFIFSSLSSQSTNCTSNWTEIRNACTTDETLLAWYNDTNQCANATTPSNRTINCDYDNNKIIGNASSPDYNNLDLQIYINNSIANLSQIFANNQTVEFKEGNITRVTFNHDFATPLDLKNILIKKQPASSTIGYLIVNGINNSKTIAIDRLNSTSAAICVKEAEITAISSVSDECGEADEELVDCPGNHAGITCEVSGNNFIVSGLEHSAVEEYSQIQQDMIICNPNWNCSNWSSCTSNQQTRICTDINSCNVGTGKPSELQTCISCVPNWTCTSWKPTTCPKNKTQTKICLDKNNCGIIAGKPSESQPCEYKSSPLLFVIILLILLLIVGGIAIYFLYFNKKTKENVIIQKPEPRALPPPIMQPVIPQQYSRPPQPLSPVNAMPLPQEAVQDIPAQTQNQDTQKLL